MSDVDLTTTVAGLRLASPILTAAGCGGTGRELAGFGDLASLGAFVTRSVTLDPQPGWRAPRLVETASGLLTAVGPHNPGLQGFLATELPWLAQQRVHTVVSIAGSTLGEYAELARRLVVSAGVSAIEVNLVSGREDAPGRTFGAEPYQTAKVLGAVRREVPDSVPVLAKLSPDCVVVDVARAAVANGADAVVLVHGFAGVAIDTDTWAPSLGAGRGVLSGPATHPLALRCVWDVHAAMPDLPLVGVGGVDSGRAALAMLLAGASAVQLGAALLHDPGAPTRVHRELLDLLDARGIASVADVVGRAHDHPGDPDRRPDLSLGATR